MKNIDYVEKSESMPNISAVLLKFMREKLNMTYEDILAVKSSPHFLIKNNPILAKYRICTDQESKKVCIKDIVGQAPNHNCKDLFELLNKSYKDEPENTIVKKSTYDTRRNDKLSLSKDEIFDSIKNSIAKDPIYLETINENEYIVSTDGCHRTSILSLMYLDELNKNAANRESIDEKYTLMCNIDKIDFTISYIYYILSTLKAVDIISKEYDSNLNFTGRFKVYNKDKSYIFLRDELINLFIEYITKSQIKDNWLIYDIKSYAQTIPSFNSFVKEYIPYLYDQIMEDSYGRTS